MAVGSVIARIITQYSDKGSKAAQRDINKLGKQFDEFGKRAFQAFAVAGVAITGLAVKIGKDSVEAAIKAQAEQNRLTQILLTTNGATLEQIELLDKQAQALEGVGVVSAGNIKVAQAQLATFDLQAETIQRLTPAILDYVTAEKGATASAEDFKQMTNGLAQALQGNFGSLTRTGFVLDEATKKQIKFGTEAERSKALVAVLNSTYEGFNKSLRETPEGKIQALRNSFEGIQTSLGTALLPVLENVVNIINRDVIPALTAWVEANKDQVAASLQSVIDNSIKAAQVISRLFKFIADNLRVIMNLGALLFGIFVGTKVFAGITAMVAAINVLRAAFVKQTAAAGTAAVATAAATGGASLLAAGAAIVAFTAATGIALGALNNMNKATSKTVKNASNLREHMARVEIASKNAAKETEKTNNFTGKTLGTEKKLSAEQKKRLEIQKALVKSKLAEFGIKTVSTTDPVSLEAARLNLVKEGQIVEVKRLEAMQKFYEQQAAVNLLSSRYADILSVINDRQVSPAEVALLAAKWGETEEAVIKYLAYVTKAPLPEGWDSPGKKAEDGWNDAISALNNYYAALKGIPTVGVPGVSTGGVAGAGGTGGVAGGAGGTGGVAGGAGGVIEIPIPVGGEAFAGTPLAGITATDLAEAFGLSSIGDLRSFGVEGNPQVTVNINSAQGEPWSDEVGEKIVQKIIDYSAIGYSTGWYRTTGNVAV